MAIHLIVVVIVGEKMDQPSSDCLKKLTAPSSRRQTWPEKLSVQYVGGRAGLWFQHIGGLKAVQRYVQVQLMDWSWTLINGMAKSTDGISGDLKVWRLPKKRVSSHYKSQQSHRFVYEKASMCVMSWIFPIFFSTELTTFLGSKYTQSEDTTTLGIFTSFSASAGWRTLMQTLCRMFLRAELCTRPLPPHRALSVRWWHILHILDACSETGFYVCTYLLARCVYCGFNVASSLLGHQTFSWE